jgi:hypothetical protein
VKSASARSVAWLRGGHRLPPIDCHKGIAHRLPKEPDELDESEKPEKK